MTRSDIKAGNDQGTKENENPILPYDRDKEYPTFFYDKERIEQYKKSLTPLQQEIYLAYVQKEYAYFREEFKQASGMDVTDEEIPSDFRKRNQNFILYLNKEIKYLAKIRKLKESNEPIAPVDKIRWQGTEGQLTYLIKSLAHVNLLTEDVREKPFAFIERHFLNKKGIAFKAKQLRQADYQGDVGKTQKSREKIDQIMEKVKDED